MKRISDFVKGTGEKIEIGSYEIRKLEDGTFWLEHESGEGTQCSLNDLEKAIHEFYKEIF